MSKCIVCNEEIVGKREGAKTCSGRCQKAAQRQRVVKIKVDSEHIKVDTLNKVDKDSVQDNVKVDKVEPYVIPMTRKAAQEICKAVAARGDGAPLTGDVKRRAFSALHNTLDCRYIEV